MAPSMAAETTDNNIKPQLTMDTDNLPSSINPSERFMDIATFFSDIERDVHELRKNKKEPDVCGFAIFQDKKSARKGSALTTAVKVLKPTQRSKELIRLADALAYEMVNDPRMMAIVCMATQQILYKCSFSSMMDQIEDKEKGEKS